MWLLVIGKIYRLISEGEKNQHFSQNIKYYFYARRGGGYKLPEWPKICYDMQINLSSYYIRQFGFHTEGIIVRLSVIKYKNC